MSDKLNSYQVRQAQPHEFEVIGELMVSVYSQLEGFPKPEDHPKYYHLLRNIGEITGKPGAELLVAANDNGHIGGAVVYFGDIKAYGAQGVADNEKDAAGFRLLAVDPATRGQGLGRKLVLVCLDKARESNKKQMVIHSTKAMQVAWGMYEKMGFARAPELDFMQEDLEVFGFRLKL